MDDKLCPSGVLFRVDHDDTLPQRIVSGQLLESDGDLTEDVDENVVMNVPHTIKYENQIDYLEHSIHTNTLN